MIQERQAGEQEGRTGIREKPVARGQEGVRVARQEEEAIPSPGPVRAVQARLVISPSPSALPSACVPAPAVSGLGEIKVK